MISEWFGGDIGITGIVSGIALMAVWLPFYRAVKLCAKAQAATKFIQPAEIQQKLKTGSQDRVEPLVLLLVRVMRKSLFETDRDAYPSEFLLDASKQYVTNEYDSHYGQPISMYANLLPPIGFIGTTGGLLILFLSMHSSNDALELGALALALTSSIFALLAFAILESLKIRLYGRLVACLSIGEKLLPKASDAERKPQAPAA